MTTAPNGLNLEDIARAVDPRAARRGEQFAIHCPCHDDDNPSASLTLNHSGDKVLVHCNAGCGQSDLYARVKALAGHLLNGQSGAPTFNAPREPRPPAASATMPPTDAPAPDYARLAPRDTTFAEAWAYHDADGRLAFHVARYRTASGDKSIRPISWVDGAWKLKAFPDPRPLYNLPALAAKPEANVIVVEGEKCAEALQAALGYVVATTWPGGANGIGLVSFEPLAGRKVVVWPDADEPGFKAMRAIGEKLAAAGATVKYAVPDADAAPGWDCVDLIAAGIEPATWLREHLQAELPLRYNGNGQAVGAVPATAQAVSTTAIAVADEVGRFVAPEDAARYLTHRFQYIAAVGAYWDVKARHFLRDAQVNSYLIHAMPTVPVEINGVTRHLRIKPVKLASESTADNKFDSIDYHPGKGRVICRDGRRALNVYRPSGVRRVSGDATRFTEHVGYLCDENETAAMTVTQWLAYLVQEPGMKMSHGLMFVNEHEGTGRGWLFEALRALLGRWNVCFADEDRLSSRFNAWLSTQLLVIPELEVAPDTRRAQALRLKPILSGDPLAIEEKGKDAIVIENRVNVISASNRIDATIVSLYDRRWWICESTSEPKPAAYYDTLYQWLAEPDTPGILLDYLLGIDLSAFNPRARPAFTTAREEAAIASMPAWEQAVRNAVEAEDGPFHRPLVIVAAVADWLDQHGHRGVAPHRIGRVLRQLGAVDLGQKRVGNVRPRVWALRSVEMWRTATEARINAEFHP